jgi:hypothetical protein
MNAIAANIAGNRWTRTFGWLLRREYWENRGGFLWAPLITGGITVFLSSLLAATVAVQARREPPGAITDLAGYLDAVGAAGDGLLIAGTSMTAVVLGFVVFFYALGSLYDDRRDRSALFWKSMPVSDTQTVLSKAAWALLLAPLLSAVIGLLVGVVLWLIAAVAMVAGGLPHASALFTHSHPFTVAGRMLATVPLDTLWMLPAVGWLMFCSALVRSKPFLWAALVPVLGCVMTTFVGFIANNVLAGPALPLGKLWYVAVYRGLMSVMPGTRNLRELENMSGDGIDGPAQLVGRILDHSSNWNAIGTWDLWIGVAVGVAFIAAAIPLRRWRDEA